MVEIQYKLQERDLIAFSEHEVKPDSPLYKQVRRNSTTIPGILCAVALFYWFYYESVLTAFYVGVVGVVWGLLAPLYFKKDFRRKVRRQFSDEDLERILGDYKLKIEKKALVEISPQGETRILWKDVLRLEVTKKYAFIYLDAHEALIVPLENLKHDEIVEFTELVDQRIEESM
ncbi:MAG: YcxB family protein [Methylococcaceae bacterium]|nr:YcxB family protein [Methylococcaceae bacterium]MCI0734301.1 YcxB family protein [Methylococcaceae bacterium]